MKKIFLLCCGLIIGTVGCGSNTAPPHTKTSSTTVSKTILMGESEPPRDTTSAPTMVQSSEKEKILN